MLQKEMILSALVIILFAVLFLNYDWIKHTLSLIVGIISVVFVPLFLFVLSKFIISELVALIGLKKYINKISSISSYEIIGKVKTLRRASETLLILESLLKKVVIKNNADEYHFESFLREINGYTEIPIYLKGMEKNEIDARILDNLALILERLKRENKRAE